MKLSASVMLRKNRHGRYAMVRERRTRRTEVARLSIPRADKLSARERGDLSNWLTESAQRLRRHGENYAPRFTERFFYY